MMRCHLKRLQDQQFVLHFDRELPRLQIRSTPFPFVVDDLMKAMSPRVCHYQAGRLAKINQGKTPFELPHPFRTYCSFLDQLVRIEGLSDIGHSSRYSVRLTCGAMFDLVDVAKRVAEVFRRHFYPDLKLHFTTDVTNETSRDERFTPFEDP